MSLFCIIVWVHTPSRWERCWGGSVRQLVTLYPPAGGREIDECLYALLFLSVGVRVCVCIATVRVWRSGDRFLESVVSSHPVERGSLPVSRCVLLASRPLSFPSCPRSAAFAEIRTATVSVFMETSETELRMSGLHMKPFCHLAVLLALHCLLFIQPRIPFMQCACSEWAATPHSTLFGSGEVA